MVSADLPLRFEAISFKAERRRIPESRLRKTLPSDRTTMKICVHFEVPEVRRFCPQLLVHGVLATKQMGKDRIRCQQIPGSSHSLSSASDLIKPFHIR